MGVELRHYRHLVAVSRASSVSAAARALGMTQPALSRAIAQAERVVGARLVERGPGGTTMTTAGRRFVTHAQAVLAAHEAALASVRPGATVTVGFAWLLPDDLSRGLAAGPSEAQVRLRRCDRPVDELRAGRIDAAVHRGSSAAPAGRGVPLLAVPLPFEQRVAAVGRGHPWASRDLLTWDEIPDQPLVVNTLNGTTTARSWPGDRSVEVVPCASFDEWLEYVAAGRGVGVVPALARERAGHPNVVYVDILDAPPVPTCLLTRRDDASGATGWLRDRAAALSPGTPR